jgi:hypothetical protein
MKLTLRHYFDFKGNDSLAGGSLQSPQAWDELRSDRQLELSSAFYMPGNRTEWLELVAQVPDAHSQARAIASLVSEGGYTAVVSCGVGRAFVEYHVKQMRPELALTCTEYSSQTVARLRAVFHECDRIHCHDFTRAGWPAADERTLFLLNRVDTELSDEQWPGVFANLAAENVRHVLVVATELLTARVLASELKRRILARILRRPLTFAGYIRTRAAFTALWRDHYRLVAQVPIGNLTGFLLARP